MVLTASAPFARAALRCHLGNEGYEYVKQQHENEGRALAAEVSIAKLTTTLSRQTGRKETDKLPRDHPQPRRHPAFLILRSLDRPLVFLPRRRERFRP